MAFESGEVLSTYFTWPRLTYESGLVSYDYDGAVQLSLRQDIKKDQEFLNKS